MLRQYLFAAAAIIALPAVAFAQDMDNKAPQVALTKPPEADSSTGTAGEVIVTATRRSTSIQKTPITVTAVTAKDVETYHLTKVEQVAALVPNFYLQPGVASGSTISLSMRGIGDNGGGFGTTDQPVAFYFDDVYEARPSAVNSEFTDIDNIEVLRGPQGTLFGRNAMVGAVDVITRTPGDTLYGMGSISYGNYDTVKAKASIGGPLIDGVLAGSLSGVYTNQGIGYDRDIATGSTIDRRDFNGVRGKLHFYGSKIWDVVAIASYTDSSNNGFVTTPVSGTAPYSPLSGNYRDIVSPLDNFGRTKTTDFSVKATADLGIITLKSITGYSKMNDGWLIDLTGGEITAAGKDIVGYSRLSGMAQDQVTQDFQAYGDTLGGRLKYIGGLYFFHENVAQSFTDNFYYPYFGGFSSSVPKITYDGTTTSYAAYTELNFKVIDGMEAVFGARYTTEKRAIDGLVNPTGPNNAYSGSTNFNAFTPKFGLNYKLDKDIFFYATISKGFKAGGYTSGSNTVAVAETPFGPESVWAYEIGEKSSWFDHHVKLNADVYYNQFSDIIVGEFLPGSLVVVQFNGESYNVLGEELEFSVSPFQGLDMYMNGGLQTANGFKFDPRVQLQQGTYVPHYSGSTGFRYEFPVPELPNSKIRFGGDYVFRDKTYGSVNNTAVAENSRISELNGEITLINSAGWQVSIIGKNLLNKLEWQNSLDLVSFLGIGSREAQAPRTFSAELSYRF